MEVLSGVAPRHPYKAYVRMKKSLQQACAFVQRITPGVREDFCPVEEALQKSFLPALFQGCKDEVLIQVVIYLPIKHSGLEIPNPTLSALENWTTSCVITGLLVPDIWGKVEFKTGYHALLLQYVSGEIRCRNVQKE